MPDTSALCALSLGVLALAFVKKWRKPALQYPPGPKGYPILGNVFDLSMSVPIWEALLSLANRHGTDILYLRLMGQDMVVLNNNETISDLIEKRSSIYADRPQSPMSQLTGVEEWALSMMPYGDKWRARRKLCHEVLNIQPTGHFDRCQYKYTHRLLSRLLEAPECFLEEVEFTPGAVIMAATYGINVESLDNPFLRAILEGLNALSLALIPGKFVVDAIPILRYIPDWFPGAGFKVLAKEARDKCNLSIKGPMEYVKDAIKSHKGFSQSIASDCLLRLEDDGKTDFDEEVVRDVSGTMFAAGAETTRSILQTFFLTMVLNPEVMKRAQEELDRVVGKDRLPDLSDRANLPYIEAVIKEVLRWGPPLPISLPTRVIQDNVYRGYFIPAGATVIQNVWAVCRDPKLYQDPDTFNPDRFLEDGTYNPENRVFGSGRRICPGRNFALQMVYLAVTCVLSVFDIEPALDDDGNPCVPEAEFKSGFARHPMPFKCTIKPRSEDTIKLVRGAGDGTNY